MSDIFPYQSLEAELIALSGLHIRAKEEEKNARFEKVFNALRVFAKDGRTWVAIAAPKDDALHLIDRLKTQGLRVGGDGAGSEEEENLLFWVAWGTSTPAWRNISGKWNTPGICCPDLQISPEGEVTITRTMPQPKARQ